MTGLLYAIAEKWKAVPKVVVRVLRRIRENSGRSRKAADRDSARISSPRRSPEATEIGHSYMLRTWFPRAVCKEPLGGLRDFFASFLPIRCVALCMCTAMHDSLMILGASRPSHTLVSHPYES
jgi:hypothetical protein